MVIRNPAMRTSIRDDFSRVSPVAVQADRSADVESPDVGRRQMALGRAQSEYELHCRRSRLFGKRVFFDPAWNILLDVFIAGCLQRHLSVTAVCIGSQVPTATALRYIAGLGTAGLLTRVADERDGRRTHIQLTEAGWASMISLLA